MKQFLPEGDIDAIKSNWGRSLTHFRLNESLGSWDQQTVIDLISRPSYFEKFPVFARNHKEELNGRLHDLCSCIEAINLGCSLQLRNIEGALSVFNPINCLASELEKLGKLPLSTITLFYTPPGEKALPMHSGRYSRGISRSFLATSQVDRARVG
ncbi:hypothetical protein [Austwickia sp. TVS 96-490-7B]|uniref:hypothetical protein n=1 Tax=Austwickia sp. TVS 96-490-7B TaxID=2830843 RepID=UPI001C56724E|nr:hypothetical protein [Austwickia sp. TVS 96-490-7B]